jgi:hypothetical protein
MRNFFGKCLALGIVGGGFALTGDLAWIGQAGTRLVSATTVPHHEASADDEAPVPVPRPADGAPSGGMSPQTLPPPPPARGPDRRDIADLRPGDRLVVWIHDAGTLTPDPLSLDIVDPASGEAILHRGVAQRVLIGGDRSLVRGGTLTLLPLGLARTGSPPSAGDALGPITALAVER